jgi:outer membrane receptor protein involved in Fe transport
VNPRVAVLIRPYENGNLKLIGGKAFRAPSIYELYYNDGGTTQIASPDLQPESIYSGEVEFTHRFSPTVTGTLAAFANYVTNLIDAAGAGDDTDPIHYVNTSTPVLSAGGEAEIRRDWRQGWMLGANYSYQRSTYLAGDSVDDLVNVRSDPTRRRVANSPEHLASVKGAVPILGRNVTIGSRVTFEGPRYDRYENDGEPQQGRTRPFVVWDFVFSGYESHWGLRWAAGVYNAFDWRYTLPLSPEFRQRTIVQNGRTFLASADVTF